ncbi:pyrimidine/purine nucleoside phosphorylase [Paenibacillus polysaccharolyticus]|uniref:pyrimidine/purine nucleoside phosphorylase n=1 Tax=Paenibacillus polysaccharolyticus TaxID=582692 RepID=UPI00203D2E97|nr:pyrimidine/purine nucleoside phosphorylase [Paenibacillus polysaccharolyticus]MCM3135453.1 pyrimidine/purine nucleoside phosphorylase [Paenibacillus polysaccharolyticus]
MSQFDQVSVVKKANIYYDGQVTSRTVILGDGSKVTLGIMLPGNYEFGTDSREIMEILSGDLRVLLPGEEEWQEIQGKATFHVPAESKFKLEIRSVTDYVCSYPAE